MPSLVTPHSEPDRKLELLNRRLVRLRGAIKAGESLDHIHTAAEKVRLAHLAIIKAKLALIREYPQRDPKGRQSAKLREASVTVMLVFFINLIIRLSAFPDCVNGLSVESRGFI